MESSARDKSAGRRQFAAFLDRIAMPAVFVIMFVTLALTVTGFCSKVNLVGLLVSVSMVGMVSCTMLFCLASGDFDLSVEATVMCSGVVTALVIQKTHSIAVGIAAGVLLGAVVGWVNGVVIARIGINALITTLATMQITKGLGFIACHGEAVSIPEERFFKLGVGYWMHLPVPVWITLGCFVLFGVLLHYTNYGRCTLAIGGNREAARLSGIPVARLRVIIFTVQGVVAGFAGCVLAARLNTGQPNVAQGFALDCISACVLGGVSLTGGSGTIVGVLVGVMIMGTVQNAMDLNDVQSFYQYLARGGILLLAVLFDQWRRTNFTVPSVAALFKRSTP